MYTRSWVKSILHTQHTKTEDVKSDTTSLLPANLCQAISVPALFNGKGRDEFNTGL